MRYEQMPDDGLECLGVRSNVRLVYCWHNDANIGSLCSVAAIAPYNPKNGSASLFGKIDSGNKIGTNVSLCVSTSNGEDKNCVFGGQATSFQPLDEYRLPTLIVCSCGQLRHIVRRPVTFDPANFSKIINSMR